MARRQRENIFGFGKSKVTYHRDVAKERRELRAHALEERKARLAAKKQTAQERAHQEQEDAAELRREKIERKKADAVDRKIEREMREAGYRNPAESGAQYRLAQAVLSGTAKAKSMSKKAAREIVDRTPKKLRSLFTKNPEDAAAALSEAWHGRPAKSATDVIDQVHYHGVLTDLGRLKEITVMVTDRKGQKIFFDSETRLASSENGKQLYVVGGDQSLDLEALWIEGEEAEKDCVVIGEVHSIVYVTAKQHLGKADKEIGPYAHDLGEDGGTMPILIYDTLNREVGFAGGSYFIDSSDYDGSHSAGIRD